MAGLTTKEESLFIAQQLAQNKLIPCALNMLCFKYDVLLSVDKSFCDFVREDIRKKYKPMLDRGATSVWEYDYYPPNAVAEAFATRGTRFPFYIFKKIKNTVAVATVFFALKQFLFIIFFKHLLVVCLLHKRNIFFDILF